jgi:hypothetical protein
VLFAKAILQSIELFDKAKQLVDCLAMLLEQFVEFVELLLDYLALQPKLDLQATVAFVHPYF